MVFLAESGCPEDLEKVIGILNTVITYIKIFIPILLIIFGSIDLGKAVMAGEEKEIKAATQLLIKKVIAAVVVFLLVNIIQLTLGIIDVGDDTQWKTCLEQYNNR